MEKGISKTEATVMRVFLSDKEGYLVVGDVSNNKDSSKVSW